MGNIMLKRMSGAPPKINTYIYIYKYMHRSTNQINFPQTCKMLID